MIKKFKPLLFMALLAAILTSCEQTETEVTTQGTKAPPSIPLPDGVTLVEEFIGADGEFAIPYGKYELDNGLTVVLHEDHSDPMVHVDVTYHVGSAREEQGRSGFAHFFEHMMFEGSENVESGEFSKIISNGGGTLNGSTNSDRTNYYETLPINQLETALWLEADRMGLLLQAVSQEEFEVQRAAVKNERGQRVDNRPYGRTSETMMKNLYPSNHPYSWPVIGWIEDLDAADLDDLKRFFLRWYGPNNATLTIGGDLDRQQTLEWIARYFGPIPSGPEVEDMEPMPGQLDQDRYITLEDNIHLPAIAMLFPTVHYQHPDEAALDAAAKILGVGQASLLYQRLVQTGRAVSAYVSHPCRELACEMSFIVVQNPASGETLAEMEAAVRETMLEFSERGVNDDDLQKFIAGFESGQVFGMQSVAGKVRNLAFAETFNDDPKTATDDIRRYAAVTREDVVRAFEKYVAGQPAVILSIVPNGKPEWAAKPQNFDYQTLAVAEVLEKPSVSPPPGENPPALRTWEDSFDRSMQPQPSANPLADLPPIWDTTLGNGVRLLAVPNTETPTVTIRALFEMGQRDEPAGKAGLASLTASLMREATLQRSAAEFSEALERIGASVGVTSGQYETSVSLNVLSKHLDAGVRLMLERLLEPAFTQEDFDRVKSRQMESLMQARKSGSALANRALGAVLAGPEHPLSYPGSGLPSTVSNISLDDVKAFYAAHIPRHLRGVLVSTSLPQDALLPSLAGLGELETSEAVRDPIEGLPQIDGRTIYLVNKEGAAQSTLRMAHPSIRFDALGEYFLAGLMNFNLGGTFDSRINLNLREEKGYTYGIYSGFNGGPELGSFRISSEINKEATAESITEVLQELESYSSSGMTEDEYAFMQNAVGQRDARSYETPGAKLGLLAQVLRYDLPLDYRKQQKNLMAETARETLNELASRLIQPDNMAIVVVGDIPEIRPVLEPLGMPIRLLDEDGNEIAQP
ncbi:MAG: insulinase family protein [Xanthomonadales bacterium]|nr:insulinase family protein [Gammaproteobacteria bacterium]NNK52518.1 insulinase family protein [Xanthomonadales bacterium]